MNQQLIVNSTSTVSHVQQKYCNPVHLTKTRQAKPTAFSKLLIQMPGPMDGNRDDARNGDICAHRPSCGGSAGERAGTNGCMNLRSCSSRGRQICHPGRYQTRRHTSHDDGIGA